MKYEIDEKQIDAAWAEASEVPYIHDPAGDWSAYDVLKHLGIVRCDSCAGTGKAGMHLDRDCGGCNGHGWRKE